jgi:hypothetical protein
MVTEFFPRWMLNHRVGWTPTQRRKVVSTFGGRSFSAALANDIVDFDS